MQAGELIGQATLMSLAFAGDDLAPIGEQLRARAAVSGVAAGDAHAWMDLSTVLQLLGQPELGLAAQTQALSLRRLYHLRPAAAGEGEEQGEGLRLLALMAPGDFMTNAPLDFLLEDSDVALDMLYVAPTMALPATLPAHDVMIVAIGESQSTQPLLALLEGAVAAWPRPVLNRPERIGRSARDCAAALLAAAAGIFMPPTARIARAALAAPAGASAAGMAYPLIVRPMDTHAGKGLARLDMASDISAYLQQTPGEMFYLSPFVDYRSPDGQYRKYRVVLVAARPYAVHMAISTHWVVHYLNAGMSDDAAKQQEEARFMASFDIDFALRHDAAWRSLQEVFGLDYLVVDCAEMADGRLLVFEVDTGAVVHAMDPGEVYPYKPVQMRRVFAAFRAMLGAAQRGQPGGS